MRVRMESPMATARLSTTIPEEGEDRFAMKLKMTASNSGREIAEKMMKLFPYFPSRSDVEREHTR